MPSSLLPAVSHSRPAPALVEELRFEQHRLLVTLLQSQTSVKPLHLNPDLVSNPSGLPHSTSLSLALDTVCGPRAFSRSYGGSVYKGNLGSDGSLKVGVFKSMFAFVRHCVV